LPSLKRKKGFSGCNCVGIWLYRKTTKHSRGFFSSKKRGGEKRERGEKREEKREESKEMKEMKERKRGRKREERGE
jgi:hypothetical protein